VCQQVLLERRHCFLTGVGKRAVQQDQHAAILDLLAGRHLEVAVELQQARLDLYRLGRGERRAGENGERGEKDAHTFLCARDEGKHLAHGRQSIT